MNSGLSIIYNGKRFYSRNGLVDLLNENMTTRASLPDHHLKGEDIEVVITHSNQYGEEYYSFVNGQHTTQGGTHLSAFKESVGRVIKEYYNKNFEYSDIRAGIVADYQHKSGGACIREPDKDQARLERYRTGRPYGSEVYR